MTFDPYHKWLGIPPDQQPPNHYRLLGVSDFESDKEVIDSAADKRLNFLHAMNNGPYGELAETISNQVSAARLTLCNAEKRSLYNKGLTQGSPPTAPNSPAAQPTCLDPKPPLPPAIASDRQTPPPHRPDSTDAWFLQHEDAIVHGPFSIDMLVNAASDRRIGASTKVRHASITGDQWVFALSISEIANSVPATAQANHSAVLSNAPTSSTSPVVVHKKRRRSNRFNLKLLVMLISSALMTLGTAYVVFQNTSLNHEPVEPTAQNLETESVVVPQQVQSSPVTQSPELPVHNDATEPTEAIPELSSAPLETESSGTESMSMAMTSVEEPTAPAMLPGAFAPPGAFDLKAMKEKSIHIDLDLKSPRWTEPLAGFKDGDSAFVMSVKNYHFGMSMEPVSGELTYDQPLRLTFADLEGFAIELKLSDQNKDGIISVAGSFLIDSNTPFRMATFRKRLKSTAQQFQSAQVQLQQVNEELERMNAIVNNPRGRPVAVVGQARNRRNALNRVLPNAQQQLTTSQSLAYQQQLLANKVELLDQQCELVITIMQRD